MTAETEALPGITPSGDGETARDILLDRAQEAIAFQTERAERAEAELAPLADALGHALAEGAGLRERAERAEAEAARLSALLEPGMTPGDAAALLGMPADSLRHLEKAGKITASRSPGGHRRYSEESVRALLEQLGTGPGGMPEKLLPARQVAAMFGVDPKSVPRWAKAGKLTRDPAGRSGYRESEVMALLRRGAEGGAA